MHHPRANQLGGFVRQPDFVEHRYAMFANVGWRQRSRRRARTEMQKGTRHLQPTEPSVLIGLNKSEASIVAIIEKGVAMIGMGSDREGACRVCHCDHGRGRLS